jgi:hypothetical protein
MHVAQEDFITLRETVECTFVYLSDEEPLPITGVSLFVPVKSEAEPELTRYQFRRSE